MYTIRLLFPALEILTPYVIIFLYNSSAITNIVGESCLHEWAHNIGYGLSARLWAIRLRKQALKHEVRDCEWCRLNCYHSQFSHNQYWSMANGMGWTVSNRLFANQANNYAHIFQGDKLWNQPDIFYYFYLHYLSYSLLNLTTLWLQ